jgi:hypothetical protein
MQKFKTETFFYIAHRLTRISKNIQSAPREQEIGNDPEEAVRNFIQDTSTACTEIGLRISVKCLDSLLQQMNDPHETYGNIVDLVAEAQRLITWEMEDRLFMFVPPERAECFDKPELLSQSVLAKFPALQFDIVEAGNCYASGRGTACVFHLMRIMETGVQEFGKKLNVSLVNEKNWQNILDEINKAIKALPKGPSATEMSQVSANLYAVKLAWRNEVMHPKDTYTLEEADSLIRQVRIFMQQLAMIV